MNVFVFLLLFAVAAVTGSVWLLAAYRPAGVVAAACLVAMIVMWFST